jgi:tetratricopeptide (TPR) repeat protein
MIKRLIKIKDLRMLGFTRQTLIILVISLVFISPLFVAGELHDPTRTGKILFFARWMILLIPVGLFLFIRNWKQPLDHLSLLVALWGAWMLIRGKQGGIWHDEKFFWFAGCWVFFFLTAVVIADVVRKNQIQWLLIPTIVITLTAATETVLGLLQLYGGFRVYHAAFKVTGTFFNPAPFAGFLLASLPWAMFLAADNKTGLLNKALYWCGFLAVILIIVIIPSTQSRAAYLGLTASVLVWVVFRYKPLLYVKHILNTKLKQRLVFTLIPLFLMLMITGLYHFKKDSANGRLLIWKVALQTIREKPLTGYGFNTVQATFAPAQAVYFATGNGSENEKMLAGSVRWAFNEPLQAASETGLPGMFLLILVTGYALFYKIPRPVSRAQYLYIGAARASVAGIAAFGCFSYPFYSLPITSLFFYALAVLAAFKSEPIEYRNRFFTGAFKTPVIAGAVMLFAFYLMQTPRLKQAYWLWDKANSLYQVNAIKEANTSFAEALPVLQHNGLFLQQYGKSLAIGKRYEEAVTLLNLAKNYYMDEYSFIALGDAYKALGETQKAEKQYQLAASMVPHKFYPLYLLAKLYNDTGQHKKAVALARQILTKEIKVPSKAIEEMREEMREIIFQNTEQYNTSYYKTKGENYTNDTQMAFKHQFW